MWTALGRIAESAWGDAPDMEGAQAAESIYRPGDWKHEPLRLIVRQELPLGVLKAKGAKSRILCSGH
jgi:hypothetical protein